MIFTHFRWNRSEDIDIAINPAVLGFGGDLNIRTSVQDPAIATSTPAKTFLEKTFLLHELFSVNENAGRANHRSRHLYDLERMMDMPFAVAAINDMF